MTWFRGPSSDLRGHSAPGALAAPCFQAPPVAARSSKDSGHQEPESVSQRSGLSSSADQLAPTDTTWPQATTALRLSGGPAETAIPAVGLAHPASARASAVPAAIGSRPPEFTACGRTSVGDMTVGNGRSQALEAGRVASAAAFTTRASVTTDGRTATTRGSATGGTAGQHDAPTNVDPSARGECGDHGGVLGVGCRASCAVGRSPRCHLRVLLIWVHLNDQQRGSAIPARAVGFGQTSSVTARVHVRLGRRRIGHGPRSLPDVGLARASWSRRPGRGPCAH